MVLPDCYWQWKISKEQKEVKKWDRKAIIAQSKIRRFQQDLSEATNDQDIQQLMKDIAAMKQTEQQHSTCCAL